MSRIKAGYLSCVERMGNNEPPEYLLTHVQEALATDDRVAQLDIVVKMHENELIVSGNVPTHERRSAIESVVRSAAPHHVVINNIEVVDLDGYSEDDKRGVVYAAAVGDVHYGTDCSGRLTPYLADLEDEADMLLITGDLTRHGTAEEAVVLATDLAECPVPVFAVLGNHDHQSDQSALITSALESAGVTVVDGTTATLEVRGVSVGIAGNKGFGGGFAGACATPFGEPQMKAFVQHTHDLADAFYEQLASLNTDVKLAMFHYSPCEDTLRGERLEIYPFLGSYLLAEAVDSAGCDMAFHGHAHAGSECGVTPGGTPVRNVAQPVLGAPYKVYPVRPKGVVLSEHMASYAQAAG